MSFFLFLEFISFRKRRGNASCSCNSAVIQSLEIDSSLLLQEEKAKAGKKIDEDYQKRTEAYTYETLTPEARHKHLKAFKVFIDPKSHHKGVSYQHLGVV